MNYIPINSYSLFDIPVKTLLFSSNVKENYLSNVSSSPYQSSTTYSTSTSSPYVEKYIHDQYNSKKGDKSWTISQKSPAKQVTSTAIKKI